MKDIEFNITKVYISSLDFHVKENKKFEKQQKSNEKLKFGLGQENDHEIKFTRRFLIDGPNFGFSTEINCIIVVSSIYDGMIREIKNGDGLTEDNEDLMSQLVEKCVNIMFDKANIYVGLLSSEINNYPIMPELNKKQ